MKILRPWIVLGILLLSSWATAQPASKKLAIVNGEVITEAQVTKAVSADLAKLQAARPKSDLEYQRERLAILWKGLNTVLENKLLAIESARDSMTKDELLAAEVEDNLQAPTDEIVAGFYDQNKTRLPFTRNLARAEALAKVRTYLIERTRKSLHDAYIAKLTKEYRVETYLDPLRKQVATAGYPSRGAANAPVTIVEFSDFECPYCGGLEPTLSKLENEYAGKVRIVYRQFPLTYVHPYAEKAAEASLCAEQQKHFWEFHDSMFANQADLTVDSLKRRAADMKLNAAAFNTCLDSGSQAAAVNKDIDEGFRLGVQGTPTMFINGRMLYGNQPYAEIRAVIEDELRRAASTK